MCILLPQNLIWNFVHLSYDPYLGNVPFYKVYQSYFASNIICTNADAAIISWESYFSQKHHILLSLLSELSCFVFNIVSYRFLCCTSPSLYFFSSQYPPLQIGFAISYLVWNKIQMAQEKKKGNPVHATSTHTIYARYLTTLKSR